MKNIIIPIVFILTCIACGSTGEREQSPEEQTAEKREGLVKKIDSLESVLKKLKSVNEGLGNEMVRAYGAFTESYPGDEMTPEYLFRAAEVAQGLNKGDIAYIYYQKIHSRYPKYRKARLSLFLQGYVSENMLGDTALARHIYNEVILSNPGDNLSEQARGCLQNLGKSPDELVKEWEKKQKPGTGKQE